MVFLRFKNTHENLIVGKTNINFYMTLIISVILFSCNPAKYVPESHFLLERSRIKCNVSRIEKKSLNEIARQRPNQKILGIFRFHLWVYNKSITGKEKTYKKWLTETIGEPPVVYDSVLSQKTRKNLEQYIQNKGYFKASVTYHERKRGNKIKIEYLIDAGEPYKISTFNTCIHPESLKAIYENNSKYSFIKKNEVFDIDNINAERERIFNDFRKNGYYYFDDGLITFEADSTIGSNKVTLTMNVPPTKNSDTTSREFRKYKFNNTWIVANYDNQELLKNKQEYLASLDTTILKEKIWLLCKGKPHVNPSVFQNCNFIKNNEDFNISDIEKTKTYLTQNRIFRQVTIETKDVSPTDSITGEGLVDCYILVSPNVKQSYTIDLEGTNTGGDLGAQVKLSYENKNLFRGAEIFTIKLTNSYEQNSVLSKEDVRKEFNSHELGAEANIEFPKFLFPFWNTNFSKKYRLRTFLQAGYSYQKIPYYERPLRYLSYGYISRSNRYFSQTFTLFEINGVQYLNHSGDFDKFIDQRSYYKYSYQDYYISTSQYSFVFNNRGNNPMKDYMYIKFSQEIAGNTLNAFCKITQRKKINGYYNIFDTRFAQYTKTDFDFRYYFIQGPRTMQAFRIFAGYALPYGNTDYLPNIKKYYSGGSNSMRAWGVRSLGPGSYVYPDSTDIIYAMGDVKLEANFEQRFPIAGVLNGALFIDAGNIWTLNNTEEGAQLTTNIIKDIAIGTGTGLRLDFSFFVLRFDMGLKTRNPANSFDEKWIWDKKISFKEDVNYTIGIGYPF